jgi:ribonuclease J
MPTNKKTTTKRTTQRRASQPRRGRTVSRGENTSQRKESSGPKGTLRIIPLGGLEEVGRNMTVLEYENDIVIIDMGLQFPEEDMPGIDYIIPNMGYFKGKEKNVRGILITHGHYDHIGGIPHMVTEIGNPPIYGTPLTLGIIAKRQEDFKKVKQKLNLQPVDNKTQLTLGKFKIEFFGVSHNIPGSLGVITNTPVGTIVHTGDFKLDLMPSGDTPADIAKIANLNDKNVLALLSDSTNASQPGHQFSEEEIQGTMEGIISGATGRLIIGTFASLLGRLQQIIWLAEKFDKKIIIEGYSMKANVEIAQRLGYMKIKRGTLISLKEMESYPPNRVIILCTGAQGEDRAVLNRIATQQHRQIKITPGDTVIFSSSVIPGNERSVQKLTDTLYREGADVINYRMMDVHAGGHAKQEDLKLMIQLVRPQYLIPIEGNHSFLKIHAKLGLSLGMSSKNIFVADNGQIMEFTNEGGRLTEHRAPVENVYVDGLGVGDVSDVVLRDRQHLAEDGMIVVIATLNSKTGKLITNPDIISRGFVYMKDNKKMIEDTRRKIRDIIQEENDPGGNSEVLKNKIRNEIANFIYHKIQRHPMILPVIIEV